MSFDPQGYALDRDGGRHVWFLDTRMTVKAADAFAFLEWTAPEGFAPPWHVHHRDDEAFYLLEGQMRVACGQRRWTLGPGGFVYLPRDVPHSFVVTGGPVRGLQITSPAGFEGFIDELGRPAEHDGLPDPTEPDLALLAEVSARYGHEILGPPPFPETAH
ncbi:cupin domain-containing protein [Nonomuraea sp. 3N208]|uniref:cupin domain-containing protein n=1 Tax=Nonomuraea sp. 3N208 TaxID=3457421 RepID=UPI003FCF9F27